MAHLAKLALLSLALGFTSSSPEPISDTELSKAVAAIIVENGFLCAAVLEVRGLEQRDLFEVTCTERAGESTTARYIMDMSNGTAVKA